MNHETIPLEKLEAVNDIIAEGIDQAGGASEVLLAKVVFFLAIHVASVDDLRDAMTRSLRDLPG